MIQTPPARHTGRAFLLAMVVATVPLAPAGADTGFYIRGDLGWGFSTNADTRDDDCGSPAPFFGCGTTLHDTSAGSSLMVGGGLGYRVTPWFRTDATIHYRPLFDVDGTIVRPGSPDRPFQSDIASVAGMINGYFDIAGMVPGRLGILQPYVMAGIGITHNDMGDIDSNHPTIAGQAQTSPGGGNISFAWALGAGMGVEMGSGFVLDFGYKYADLGQFKSDSGLACSGGTCRNVDSVVGDLQIHEFSAGVRYGF